MIKRSKISFTALSALTAFSALLVVGCQPSSMRATINVQNFAGDKLSRREIENGVNDLGDFGQSLDRVKFAEKLVIVVCVHRCVDHTRGDGVDADTLRRIFDR